MDLFERKRAAAGASALPLALDRVGIVLNGLDAELSGALRARYGPYVDDRLDAGRAMLSVDVARDPTPYFIEPPAEGTSEFNPVWLACENTRVRYCGYALAGWFDTAQHRGAIVLGTGPYEPEPRAVENYVRCAVAWCAAESGGALVHGASAVRGGKGYLFFGESGAGKSTLSEVNRRARVVSDDLSLLLPREDGGLDLVGSPFRGTYEGGEPVVGRFPLAAGFRIVKAEAAAVRTAPRPIVFGQLVGNLTFVAEAFPERADLFERVERAFAKIPLHRLEFRKDDSYWDAIDAAGL
jgi:hypothetical protein